MWRETVRPPSWEKIVRNLLRWLGTYCYTLKIMPVHFFWLFSLNCNFWLLIQVSSLPKSDLYSFIQFSSLPQHEPIKGNLSQVKASLLHSQEPVVHKWLFSAKYRASQSTFSKQWYGISLWTIFYQHMVSIFLFVELFKNCALALVLVLVKAFLDMSQLQVFCHALLHCSPWQTNIC